VGGAVRVDGPEALRVAEVAVHVFPAVIEDAPSGISAPWPSGSRATPAGTSRSVRPSPPLAKSIVLSMRGPLNLPVLISAVWNIVSVL
jgi:hypothetical protein